MDPHEQRHGQRPLRGVGSTGSDVFAVGDEVILHYDGTAWIPMSAPSGVVFNDIWGNSGTDVFVVGDVILHYDGAG